MRLFFALPVPAEAKERLRPSLDAARKTGGEGVSFPRPEQLHFPLAFLGEQPGPDEALAAGEILRETPAFELGPSGVAPFPYTARPRVLWLGVSAGAAELMETADWLRGAWLRRGSGFEEPEFRPHLTFGRVRP